MEHLAVDQTTDGQRVDESWALLGTIGAGGRAAISRRGVITPEGGSWSLDWWVGAEDRWHIASSGAHVRQALVEATPVIVSGLRLPGGEIEQCAWSAVDGATGLPVLVVDFHNATKIPVAVAIAISGSSSATAVVDVVDGAVTVNGDAVALFSRQPSRYGIAENGRSAQDVTAAGDAVPEFPKGGVSSSSGSVTVGFVFPLPHTATLRVVLPLRSGVASSELLRIDVATLPPQDRVIAGWKAQLARAPRFDFPERQIETEEAIDAARGHLLVHVAGDDPLRWPGVPVDGLERSELTMALDEQGLSAEAERLLLAATDLQNSDGSLDGSRLDATASWVVAVERHVALTANNAFAEGLVERVASAVHWLSKRQRGSRLRPSRSFFATGEGPEWLAVDDRRGYDARWTARAYRSAISLLDGVGETDAALAVRLHLVALTEGIERLSIDADGPGDGARRPDAVAKLRSDLLEGEPLWTWSSATDSHDPARTAAFLRNVRSLVVNDSGSTIDVLPAFGEDWLGQPVAVLRVPTIGGSLSFALRWHGARPAILWEVEGDRPFTLTCSAIDPSWSTTDRRGEALLDAPVIDHVHTHVTHDHDHGHDHGHDHSEPAKEPPVDGGVSFS
jgi:hypothetical protein